MLIGQVYRLKVGNIPGHEGQEVFPTIEVIDRLYPPPGQAARFPIPIELTQEELEYALDGRYVLRVIYLEDRRRPCRARDAGQAAVLRDCTGQDAMEAADRLGRPVAILRMGSRVPLPDEDDGQFLYQHRRCCCSSRRRSSIADAGPGSAAGSAAESGAALDGISRVPDR